MANMKQQIKRYKNDNVKRAKNASYKSALKTAIKKLLAEVEAGNKDGAVEERYIQAMIQKIETYGPYIVICPGTALPHADAEEGVIYEAASLMRLKKPVDFHHEMNDPVKYVIGMSVKSAESVNQAIYDLMMIFGNERIRQILDKAVDKASIMEALDGLTTAK